MQINTLLTTVLLIYFILINITGFLAMGTDKKRAIKKTWRISEKQLFMYAMLGGSIGSIAGMKVFHHKTKHKRFQYGMPLILGIQIILLVLIFFGITHFGF
ncbi:MAG: DUF1294 domain-containing protein [Anaerocolumna sp.]